jgi:hypothetical protein
MQPRMLMMHWPVKSGLGSGLPGDKRLGSLAWWNASKFPSTKRDANVAMNSTSSNWRGIWFIASFTLCVAGIVYLKLFLAVFFIVRSLLHCFQPEQSSLKSDVSLCSI